MKNITKIFTLFTLFVGFTACSQNIPVSLSNGTYTVQSGKGQFGGAVDLARLYRYDIAPIGNFGSSAYFQGITNSAQSQVGLGLISDKIPLALKGRSKSIYALFENGGIVIKHRPTDGGMMSNVGTVPNVPMPAFLKFEVTGNDVTFYYSTSAAGTVSPAWVAIGTYSNVLTNWTNTKKIVAWTSQLTAPQTAVFGNIQNFTVGSGQYAMNGISVAQSSDNVTRFKITPTETNKPIGNVTYSLTIKDINGNVVYSDPSISANTSTYPTIDFTPNNPNVNPRVTSAGTYTVTLSSGSSTVSKSVTFTNANLGITNNPNPPTPPNPPITGGGSGASSVLSYSNNPNWNNPTPNTTATIKYINTKNGATNWNGNRTIDLIKTDTSDPNLYKITVIKSGGRTGNYSILFVNGTLISGSDFFVRLGEINQVTWLYSNNSFDAANDLYAGTTDCAVLIFNVTKNN